MNYNLKKNNIIYLLPIGLIVGLIPLVVFAKKVKIHRVLEGYWLDGFDFFSYYKMILLLIFSLFSLISFMIYYYKERKLKKSYYYIPLEIYLIFIILSTVYSASVSTAIKGIPDRYEGMLVLIAYLVVMFVTMNLLKFKSDYKFLLTTIFFSASIISIVGLFQYLGYDLLTNLLDKRLILPNTLYQVADKIQIKFDYIFSTLYNPNYVGSYMSMLLSLTVTLYLLTTNRKNRVILYLINLLIFSNWLGCLSRAGILGFFAALIFLIFFIHNKILDNLVANLALFLGFILIFMLMNHIGEGRLTREFLSIKDEMKMKYNSELKDIKINGNNMIFITKNNKLRVKYKDSRIIFKDDKYSMIDYYFDEKTGEIKLNDIRYQNYKFKFRKAQMILNFKYNNKKANFKIRTDDPKGFWIIGFKNKGYKSDKVDSWGFVGKERLASGRGYIWSRSIPLIRETLLIGYGPDLYPFYFPQYDSIGKLLTFGTTKVIVDKPHNMYLQVALNTGLISLIALLAIFIMYFIESIIMYYKNKFDNFYSKVGLGLFLAFIAYAISGVFNDSVVSVAPVFWVLLGMGVSVNLKLKTYKKGDANEG